jgi:uncharacterized coiled-coil DUF342 family protein
MEASHTRAKQLKADIAALKKECGDLHQKKEAAFKKKQESKKAFITEIQKLQHLKKDLDQSKKQKTQYKKQRDVLNKKTQTLIKQIKDNTKEREKIVEKHGSRVNPETLKKKIQALDTKIETEALALKEEKKIMDHIKTLKKTIQELETVASSNKSRGELSKNITSTKEQANMFHQQLKEKRHHNQKTYHNLKNITKQLKNLKKQQQKAFKEFTTLKQQFQEKNEILKHKLKEFSPIAQEQAQQHQKKRQQREQHQVQQQKQLEQEVEQKLKTKKKLTTEDLLVFQKK